MITPERIANAIREERLQCAVEMCLEIAEDELQLTCIEGLVSETVGESSLPASLLDLQRVRIGQVITQNSVVSIVSKALLDKAYCRRSSPMSIVEKSDLLEKVRIGFSQDDTARLIIDKILELVRFDESLSPLDLKAIEPELQGLILFLGHNDSPSRMLELRRTDFDGLTSAGLMIATFMVGLRFRRQTLQSGQVFVPFRNTQILKVVAILNGSSPPDSAQVRREGDNVFINNVRYERRSRFFAFEIPLNNLVVYAGVKSDFSKFARVKLIAVKNLSSIGSIKIIERPFMKDNLGTKFFKNINFEDFKLNKIRVFKNRPLLESDFNSEKCLEIKLKSDIWIYEQDESPTKLKNVLLQIRLEDLKQFKVEAPKAKKVKKTKRKRHVEAQLSISLVEEVLDQSNNDEKADLKYWKKEFKSLFKIKSIKMRFFLS